MNLIKPEKLKKGDTIGILATAGSVEDKENVFRAQKFFENLGYKVVLSSNVFDEYRYLAGTDEKKIEELHKFFSDPKINAIICMRGGYGAIRLIKKLDYDLIRKNPKIFCGYSDISALSAMILKKSNLMTFWGPLAQSDFGIETPDEFTVNSFFNAVTSNELSYKPAPNKLCRSGEANGILWGGNLATIVSLCGQDFIPEEDFIFFAEDLNESVYKIDKMMTQLINIEQFTKNIKGIVLGDFLDIDNENWLDELFFEIGEKLNIPVIGGFKITHDTEKITLPYGAKAHLSPDGLVLNY